MRFVTGIVLLLLSGCMQETRRGKFRPDGSKFVILPPLTETTAPPKRPWWKKSSLKPKSERKSRYYENRRLRRRDPTAREKGRPGAPEGSGESNRPAGI